jgi:hypothetical protein
MDLKRGTQIAYVPTHTKGDLQHPDVEVGFVTSVQGGTAFCRYWSKCSQGELRTKANSESTPIEMLIPYTSVPSSWVRKELRIIKMQESRVIVRD